MSPTRALRQATRFSWLVSLTPLAVIIYFFSTDPKPTASEYWEVGFAGLLWVWLFFASTLTRCAIYRHQEFQWCVKAMGHVAVRPAQPLAPPRKWRVVPGIVFGVVGAVALITSHPERHEVRPIAHMVAIAVVTAAFYYAGMAFYAAQKATENARRVADDLACYAVNRRHGPDELCGLGFVRRLADDVSLLVLSGACAMPLAVLVLRYQWAALAGESQGGDIRIVRGIGMLAAVGCVGSWAYFALTPTIRVRHRLQHHLRRTKHRAVEDLLRRLAEPSNEPERAAVMEELTRWRAIRTDLFFSLNAYRDALFAGASVLAGVAPNLLAM